MRINRTRGKKPKGKSMVVGITDVIAAMEVTDCGRSPLAKTYLGRQQDEHIRRESL